MLIVSIIFGCILAVRIRCFCKIFQENYFLIKTIYLKFCQNLESKCQCDVNESEKCSANCDGATQYYSNYPGHYLNSRTNNHSCNNDYDVR